MVVKENRYGVIVENEMNIEKIAEKTFPHTASSRTHLYF